jgi:hypothetical protein
VIALGALAIIVAVGVLLSTFTAIANSLGTAVIVSTATLPLLVAFLWRRWLDPTGAIVQTDELAAALGRGQTG